jgi:hypothetical protein
MPSLVILRKINDNSLKILTARFLHPFVLGIVAEQEARIAKKLQIE